MTNILDVARLANVSAMTVSRVINKKGYVKDETKKRVLKAMDTLNYVPNDLARSLVRKQTQMICLIVPDITNPFFTTMVRGIEDTARNNNYQVILCNSDENVQKEREYIEMCLRIRVDGVVIAPAGDRSKKNLKLLERQHIPFVLVDRRIDGLQSDAVLGDSVLGARDLVEHLIELGHQRIAILTGSMESSTSKDRLEGYKQALEKHSIPFETDYVKENTFVKSSKTGDILELLSLPHPPTAIFAINNFLAVNTFHQLKELGIRVPQDISIVSFDEVDPMNVAAPFFTAAVQPAYNFGTIGMQLLIERINGTTSTRTIMLKPAFTLRDSTTNVKV